MATHLSSTLASSGINSQLSYVFFMRIEKHKKMKLYYIKCHVHKHVYSHTHTQCILDTPMSSCVSFLFLSTPLTENATSISTFVSLCFICKPQSLTKGGQHVYVCGHVHWRLKPLQWVNNLK